MREIKFRALKGKHSKESGWRFWKIYEDAPPYVIRETIGQFTGLKDAKGADIFEGDILERPNHRKRVVEWFKDAFILSPIGYSQTDGPYRLHSFLSDGKAEIIGNVYENPELLGMRPEINADETNESDPKPLTDKEGVEIKK